MMVEIYLRDFAALLPYYEDYFSILDYVCYHDDYPNIIQFIKRLEQ